MAELFRGAASVNYVLQEVFTRVTRHVVQHNILAAYYVMYRIFAVAQAGGVVPGGHS